MPQEPDFLAALEQAITLATELEQLLLAETATIESRNPDELQALVDKKRQVLGALEQQTAELQRILEQQGYPFTLDGVNAYLTTLPVNACPDQGCAKSWQKLRDVTASCERMNRANAKTIERHRRRVGAALKLIRGEDETAATYSADGLSHSSAVLGRTLTQA